MRNRRINKPLRVIHSVEELPVICDCAEAGLLLRCYPETVARMARDGILPGVKVGVAWRFRRDDLVAYLDRLFERGGMIQSENASTQKQSADPGGRKENQ